MINIADFAATAGIVLGICGSLLTAIPNPKFGRAGFLLYFCANAPLLWHAIRIQDTGFTMLYAVFTFTACAGIFLRTDIGRKTLVRLGLRILMEPGAANSTQAKTG